MKIGWLQDLDPMTEFGGAQFTDRAHIVTGFRRGHDVHVLVPGKPSDPLESFDLVIVSNCTSVALGMFEEMRGKKVPFVFFFHDFGPMVCKYRLLFPMEERCRSLCYLRERWAPILRGARLNIWLSPLHRTSFLWAYPWLRHLPYRLVPSPVDGALFYDMGLARRGVLAVNSDVSFKGVDNLIRWAEENSGANITLVGGNPEGRTFPPNVTLVSPRSYSEMNQLYNEHEVFLHLASNIEPFGRTCAEALLAGCRVVGNRNVGALSYPWFRSAEDVARNCALAPQRFWEAVEASV